MILESFLKVIGLVKMCQWTSVCLIVSSIFSSLLLGVLWVLLIVQVAVAGTLYHSSFRATYCFKAKLELNLSPTKSYRAAVISGTRSYIKIRNQSRHCRSREQWHRLKFSNPTALGEMLSGTKFMLQEALKSNSRFLKKSQISIFSWKTKKKFHLVLFS